MGEGEASSGPQGPQPRPAFPCGPNTPSEHLCSLCRRGQRDPQAIALRPRRSQTLTFPSTSFSSIKIRHSLRLGLATVVYDWIKNKPNQKKYNIYIYTLYIYIYKIYSLTSLLFCKMQQRMNRQYCLTAVNENCSTLSQITSLGRSYQDI